MKHEYVVRISGEDVALIGDISDDDALACAKDIAEDMCNQGDVEIYKLILVAVKPRTRH